MTLPADLPSLLAAHPGIAALADRSAMVLHGSRTIDIVDAHADTDIWVLTEETTRAEFSATHGTTFVDFKQHGPGHFQVESIAELTRRASACELELISELRYAVILSDPAALADELLMLSRRPMSDAVRLAWFRYHYVEFRSEHRAAQGPIERGEPIGLLIAMTQAIEHALQAAMVLDREPYRYSKWLARMATRTLTGAKVVAGAENIIAAIDSDALHHSGPEATHPLSLALRQVRRVLIDAARAGGIDEPWLNEWWLHIDKARDGVRDVTWG